MPERTQTTVFLVAYIDHEGPYAVAFTDREKAERFALSMGETVIETSLDIHPIQA